MRSRLKENARSRAEILSDFYASPDESLHNERTVAAVHDCSVAKLQRDRWAGTGLRFYKRGRNVLYRKSDVLAAVNSMPAFQSTSAADAA